MKRQTYVAILLLFAFVGAAFVFSDGFNVLNKHPSAIHQWRQSVSYSYVRTYYERNSDLLSPATFCAWGKEGKVAGEFPILY